MNAIARESQDAERDDSPAIPRIWERAVSGDGCHASKRRDHYTWPRPLV